MQGKECSEADRAKATQEAAAERKHGRSVERVDLLATGKQDVESRKVLMHPIIICLFFFCEFGIRYEVGGIAMSNVADLKDGLVEYLWQ